MQQPAECLGAEEKEAGESDGGGPRPPRNIRVIAPIAFAGEVTGGDEVPQLAGGLGDDAEGAVRAGGALALMVFIGWRSRDRPRRGGG